MAVYNGGLKFQVLTGNLPISNAEVTIFDSNSNEQLFQVYTDSSGETEVLTLPAPQPSYSTEGGAQPYSTYNAEITADGFIPIRINGIQIFPNVISLQPVAMTPGSGKEELIVVEPPTLWGDYPEKIPEEEVKDIPNETGFVVLDRVVIPEYIVVHDGTPNSSGENYYVPFKDYIKNVASAEIYSTWDDAALRANILAIMSFTLNRVYTEWYRNKGYDFTITNSTAYDQSFEYGRTVFEEISQIVDEMFTTYIKREGSNQPLFAQYSDGRKVVRDGWLSQWGSQELAQQGYTATEILRYYYGNNVYLEQAEAVSGVPISYPGVELAIGSTGSAVTTIQNQLNTIGKTYYTVGRPTADGIFGENTADSVRAFQKIFNLPQTGVVDFATWYEISQIYVALEKLAEL